MFGSRTLIASSMISCEAEDVSGRTSAEIERVLYARPKNFDFLEKANGADRQEQWSVKVEKTPENAGSGSLRVRKSINLREPGAAVQYIMSSKLDIGNAGSSAETPEQSTADQFNIFKYLANKGMLKDRYYYPIEGTELNWEVDCFAKDGGLYHDWVKIDLEKWPRGHELPALPFEFVELIDGSPETLTEENAAKISELYDTIFLTKNTMRPLADYDEPAPTEPNEEGQQTNPQEDGDGTGGNPDDDDDGQSKPDDDDANNNPDDNQDPDDSGDNKDPENEDPDDDD